MTKKILNMTQGDPLWIITIFALPMIFSNLFQQLYNVVDSMIIGRYLGMQPFAAVGSTGMITAVLVQLSTGLALGGSIVVSQMYGAGRQDRIRICTTTLSIFMVAFAVVLTAGVYALCTPVLHLIRTPDTVMGYAETYLRIYVLGCVPVFLYNALGSIYSALGNSRTPLRFLVLSSVLNILLDLVFITVFGMGVGGAAAATVISQTAAMIMALCDIPGLLTAVEEPVLQGTVEEDRSGIAPAKDETAAPSPKNRESRKYYGEFFDVKLLKSMLRFAIPAAIQQSVVSVGSVVVQATINSFGTTVMAASAAAAKVINLASTVSINYSNAYGNYVGQNIGARKFRRIYEGLRASMLCCGGISLLLTAILEIFSRQLIQLFISGDNAEEAILIGAVYIRVVGAFLLLFTVYMLTKAVFKGSGDMGWFLFVTMLSFVVRLILTVGFAHRAGIWMIWWSYGIGWIIAYSFSLGRLLQGGWKKKAIDRQT